MKRPLLTLTILSLFLFQRCSQEEAPSQAKSKLTFNLSNPGLSSGRVKSPGISGAKAVVFSLLSSTGEEILTHQKINIIAFGDGFITEPVELQPGHYQVTDFYLVDDSLKVLYAAPHKGSYLGKLLKHPLDQNFSVAINKITNLPVEVIEVEGFNPADFGYSSFDAKALKLFPLSVHIMKNGKPAFTTATAYIIKNGDTISVNNLTPSINNIKFSAEPNETCKLVILKEGGFLPYSKQFTLKSLIAEIGNKPLNITLTPALTFNLNFPIRDNPFEQNLFSFQIYTNQNSNITVHFSDGGSENLSFEDIDSSVFISDFQGDFTSGKHSLYITGDIQNITDYVNYNYDATLTNFNSSNLPNIRVINFFFGGPSDLLDLRNSPTIEQLNLSGDSILLPKKNNLNFINMDNQTQLAGSINYIINNLYVNTVARPHYGGFNFTIGPEDSSGTEWVGNPTPESWKKLRKLRDTYGWTINPNP